MSKELGDGWTSGPRLVRTEESDGTNLSVGDAVTMDSNEQVAPTGDGDDLYGVVVGPANNNTVLSNLSAGDPVSVCTFGDVIANTGANVTRGDLLETSSTAGQLAQNTTGTEQDVDEGGTATYTLALQTAKAYSDASGTIDGYDLPDNATAIFVV